MNALWAYAEMAPRGFEPPTNGHDRGDPIYSAVDALYARLACLATASNGEGNEDENENEKRSPKRNLNPAEAAGAFAACAKIKTRALVPDAPAATVRALCETARETAEKMSAKEAATARGLARGSTPPTTAARRRARAGVRRARRRHRSNGASHERPRRAIVLCRRVARGRAEG